MTDILDVFDQIAPLAETFPTTFPAWQVTFMNAYVCGELSPRRTFSYWEREDVQNFASFLRTRLHHLNVLDIGGGTRQAAYLYDIACTVVSIDPLIGNGVAERLPQDDDTYDVCLFATSLDHVCHVPTALREASRVLKRDGHIIVWSNKHAPPRQEWVQVDGVWYKTPPAASDPFHYRQLGQDAIRMEMKNIGFELTGYLCKADDQCFQEFGRW